MLPRHLFYRLRASGIIGDEARVVRRYRHTRLEAELAEPETPKLMVDVVIPSEEGVVLIRRGSEPFKGQWALPGGFVEVGETVEQEAARETAEETGLNVELARLVGVYSEPDRDPRGHNVSVAFLARVLSGELSAASDAAEVAVLDPGSVELAFDHRRIVDEALGIEAVDR